MGKESTGIPGKPQTQVLELADHYQQGKLNVDTNLAAWTLRDLVGS